MAGQLLAAPTCSQWGKAHDAWFGHGRIISNDIQAHISELL
jgi:hypothetical protein